MDPTCTSGRNCQICTDPGPQAGITSGKDPIPNYHEQSANVQNRFATYLLTAYVFHPQIRFTLLKPMVG